MRTVVPSLSAIAGALGGRVIGGRNPHVAAPFPGKRKHDRSLHVFINGDDIGVHVFRDGVDPIEMKDYVRRACGMDEWKPKRKQTKKREVSFAVRNQFFGETLAVCRFRKAITAEQFGLLINDLRLRGDTRDAVKYMREFRMDASILEACMATTPRHHNADERAEILNLLYRERQLLQLRRTGSIDVDKAGRERARRERYNAKRRAARAAAPLSGVNRRSQVEGRTLVSKKEGGTTTRTDLTSTRSDKSTRIIHLGERAREKIVARPPRRRLVGREICGRTPSIHHRKPNNAPAVVGEGAPMPEVIDFADARSRAEAMKLRDLRQRASAIECIIAIEPDRAKWGDDAPPELDGPYTLVDADSGKYWAHVPFVNLDSLEAQIVEIEEEFAAGRILE